MPCFPPPVVFILYSQRIFRFPDPFTLLCPRLLCHVSRFPAPLLVADLCSLPISSGRASSAVCSWWPCSGEWLPPCSTCPALPSSTEHSLPAVCW